MTEFRIKHFCYNGHYIVGGCSKAGFFLWLMKPFLSHHHACTMGCNQIGTFSHGDVVLDTVNMAFRNDDNIFDKIYEKSICSVFL